MKTTFWTDANVERLRELWANEASLTELGVALGCTAQALNAKGRRLGLPKRAADRNGFYWNKEAEATLRRLWAAGISSTEIAGQIGKSQKAILEKRALLKLPVRQQGPSSWGRPKGSPGTKARAPTVHRELPLPPQCEPVRLIDRTDRQCCWIIGEPAGPSTMMCGAPKRLEASWCQYHERAGYTAGTAPARSLGGKSKQSRFTSGLVAA